MDHFAGLDVSVKETSALSPCNTPCGMMRVRNGPEPSHMRQMHRQSLTAYGQPLCETVVECPSPRGSEVLVRIERCGVCHSDLHLQDGYFSLGGDKKLDVSAGRTLPFTLGHEIAGVIESVGARRRRDRRPPRCRLSLDRLRDLRGVSRRRREFVLEPSPPRHRRRRRLRYPRFGSASALPA